MTPVIEASADFQTMGEDDGRTKAEMLVSHYCAVPVNIADV